MSGAGRLNAARAFDTFRARPRRGSFNDVVADKEAVRRVLVVVGPRQAVFDVVDVATPEDKARRPVADDAVGPVAQRQFLEPDVVTIARGDDTLGGLRIENHFPLAVAAPDDRLARLAALFDREH